MPSNAGFTVLWTVDDWKISVHPTHDSHLISYASEANLWGVVLGRIYDFASENLSAAHILIDRLKASRSTECLPTSLQIEGEYSFAVLDEAKSQLILSRDFLGTHPLYWGKLRRGIVASTSLREVRKHQEAATLNENFIIDYLSFNGQRGEPTSEDTVWTHCRRVLPSQTLVFDSTGNITQRKRTDPKSLLSQSQGVAPEEFPTAYRAALQGAIARRLHGHNRVACHFSGGFDSTTIAVLTHRICPAPLELLSMVYEDTLALQGETALVYEMAPLLDGSRLSAILGDDCLDYDVLALEECPDEPYNGFWRVAFDQKMLAHAKNQGVSLVLSGSGSDEVHERLPQHLEAMWRKRRYWKAWKEACRWGLYLEMNAWNVLSEFAWTTTQPASENITSRPLISSAFRQRSVLDERRQETELRATSIQNDDQLNGVATLLRCRANDFVRHYLAAPLDIVVSHPFLDPQVLSLGLAAQQHAKSPPLKRKALLRSAMGADLPRALSKNYRKGHFTELYYRGLQRNFESLSAIIHQAKTDWGTYLDMEAVQSLLSRERWGVNPQEAGSELDMALGLIIWATHPNHDVLPLRTTVFSKHNRHG